MEEFLETEKKNVPFIKRGGKNGSGTVYFTVMSGQSAILMNELTMEEIREKVESGELDMTEEELIAKERYFKEQEKRLAI